jgi:hypothetical protein
MVLKGEWRSSTLRGEKGRVRLVHLKKGHVCEEEGKGGMLLPLQGVSLVPVMLPGQRQHLHQQACSAVFSWVV